MGVQMRRVNGQRRLVRRKKATVRRRVMDSAGDGAGIGGNGARKSPGAHTGGRKSPGHQSGEPKRVLHEPVTTRQEKIDLRQIGIPAIYKPLWTGKHTKVFLVGGRGAARTKTAARYFAQQLTAKPGYRLLAVRWELGATGDNLRDELIEALDIMGEAENWKFTKNGRFTNMNNGSCVIFKGLQGKRGLRGLPNLDGVWVEEIQEVVNQTDWDHFVITVLRKSGFKAVLTGNKENRDDIVWTYIQSHKKNPKAILIESTYLDNPWISDDFQDEIDGFKERDYSLYENIFLGKFLDQNERSVIQRVWIEAAIEMFETHKAQKVRWETQREFGADPADGGDAFTLAGRAGPFLQHVEDMKVKEKGRVLEAMDDVHERLARWAVRLNYDRGGSVGNQVATFYMLKQKKTYQVVPVYFGTGITGKETFYDGVTQNQHLFKEHGDQMAWSLRGRFQNTFLLSGVAANKPSPVALEHCILIDPKCCNGKKGAPSREEFIRQMTQAVFTIKAGRIKVEKAPNGRRSPDIFDAVRLAYRSDVDNGLIAMV